MKKLVWKGVFIMELLTKEMEEKFPKLKEGDGTAHVKFYLPDTKWKWYACEYDPEEKIFYGLVEGQDKLWGRFTLAELEELKAIVDTNFVPRIVHE